MRLEFRTLLALAALLSSTPAFAGEPELVCSFTAGHSAKNMTGYQVHHVRAGSKIIARLSTYTHGSVESIRTLSGLVLNTGSAKKIALGKEPGAEILVNRVDEHGLMLGGSVESSRGSVPCYPLVKD